MPSPPHVDFKKKNKAFTNEAQLVSALARYGILNTFKRKSKGKAAGAFDGDAALRAVAEAELIEAGAIPPPKEVKTPKPKTRGRGG